MAPGDSRKEATRIEDDACDPFLPEDISSAHSYFKWTPLLPQSAVTGGHLLCAGVCARRYCAPIKIPALPVPVGREHQINQHRYMTTHCKSLDRNITDVFRQGIMSSRYVWGVKGKGAARAEACELERS